MTIVARADRSPVFFRIAIGLFALLLVFGAAVTALLIAVTAVSTPMYRRVSLRGLYWYSPLSVYASIVICGLVIAALRQLIGDFAAGRTRWAVGLQTILGSRWGVTVLVPIALAVQLLAYVNHRVLRRILTAS